MRSLAFLVRARPSPHSRPESIPHSRTSGSYWTCVSHSHEPYLCAPFALRTRRDSHIRPRPGVSRPEDACGAHARAPFPPPTTHAKGREASTCGSVAPTGAHSAPFAARRTVVPHDAARAGAANIAPGGVIGEVVMKWAVWAERFVKLAPRANNDDKPAGTRLRHSKRAPGSDAIPPSSLEKARVG